MPICFVLINATPGYEQKALNKLTKLPEIVESHVVSGEYDIIAKLKVDDLESLTNIVTTKIRSIEGVNDTRTLTGLKLE
jgi:DNA-binding Lrp family transcriptional regulator